MDKARAIPGQSLTNRLFGRAASRANVGPKPTFFHRMGITDPFAMEQSAMADGPAGMFTYLSAEPYYAEMRGMGRFHSIHRMNSRRWGRAGFRLGRVGPEALGVRPSRTAMLAGLDDPFVMLDAPDAEAEEPGDDAPSVRPRSKSPMARVLSRDPSIVAAGSDEVAEILRDALALVRGPVRSQAEAIVRSVARAPASQRPAAARKAARALGRLAPMSARWIEPEVQLQARVASRRTSAVAAARADAGGVRSKSLRTMLATSPALLQMEHASQPAEMETPTARAIQAPREPTAPAPRSMRRVAREQARTQQAAGRAGPASPPRSTAAAVPARRPTERAAQWGMSSVVGPTSRRPSMLRRSQRSHRMRSVAMRAAAGIAVSDTGASVSSAATGYLSHPRTAELALEGHVAPGRSAAAEAIAVRPSGSVLRLAPTFVAGTEQLEAFGEPTLNNGMVSASGKAPAPTASGKAPAPTASGKAPAPTASGKAPAPTASGKAPAPTASGKAPAPTASGKAPVHTASAEGPAPSGSARAARATSVPLRRSGVGMAGVDSQPVASQRAGISSSLGRERVGAPSARRPSTRAARTQALATSPIVRAMHRADVVGHSATDPRVVRSKSGPVVASTGETPKVGEHGPALGRWRLGASESGIAARADRRPVVGVAQRAVTRSVTESVLGIGPSVRLSQPLDLFGMVLPEAESTEPNREVPGLPGQRKAAVAGARPVPNAAESTRAAAGRTDVRPLAVPTALTRALTPAVRELSASPVQRSVESRLPKVARENRHPVSVAGRRRPTASFRGQLDAAPVGPSLADSVLSSRQTGESLPFATRSSAVGPQGLAASSMRFTDHVLAQTVRAAALRGEEPVGTGVARTSAVRMPLAARSSIRGATVPQQTARGARRLLPALIPAVLATPELVGEALSGSAAGPIAEKSSRSGHTGLAARSMAPTVSAGSLAAEATLGTALPGRGGARTPPNAVVGAPVQAAQPSRAASAVSPDRAPAGMLARAAGRETSSLFASVRRTGVISPRVGEGMADPLSAQENGSLPPAMAPVARAVARVEPALQLDSRGAVAAMAMAPLSYLRPAAPEAADVDASSSSLSTVRGRTVDGQAVSAAPAERQGTGSSPKVRLVGRPASLGPVQTAPRAIGGPRLIASRISSTVPSRPRISTSPSVRAATRAVGVSPASLVPRPTHHLSVAGLMTYFGSEVVEEVPERAAEGFTARSARPTPGGSERGQQIWARGEGPVEAAADARRLTGAPAMPLVQAREEGSESPDTAVGLQQQASGSPRVNRRAGLPTVSGQRGRDVVNSVRRVAAVHAAQRSERPVAASASVRRVLAGTSVAAANLEARIVQKADGSVETATLRSVTDGRIERLNLGQLPAAFTARTRLNTASAVDGFDSSRRAMEGLERAESRLLVGSTPDASPGSRLVARSVPGVIGSTVPATERVVGAAGLGWTDAPVRPGYAPTGMTLPAILGASSLEAASTKMEEATGAPRVAGFGPAASRLDSDAGTLRPGGVKTPSRMEQRGSTVRARGAIERLGLPQAAAQALPARRAGIGASRAILSEPVLARAEQGPEQSEPVWAQRASGDSEVIRRAQRLASQGSSNRMQGGLLTALRRADGAEDVVRVILEQGGGLGAALNELPTNAQGLIERIAGVAEAVQGGTLGARAGNRGTTVPSNQVQTIRQDVLHPVSTYRGSSGRSVASATRTRGAGASNVTKLANKLMKLIHLAESDRRADAQSQVRMAEDTASARAEGQGSGPGQSGDDKSMNIKALRQDVLMAVLQELENIRWRAQEDPNGPSKWC